MSEKTASFQNYLSHCLSEDLLTIAFLKAAIQCNDLQDFYRLSDMILEEIQKRELPIYIDYSLREFIIRRLQEENCSKQQFINMKAGLIGARCGLAAPVETFEDLRDITRLYNYIDGVSDLFASPDHDDAAVPEATSGSPITLPYDYRFGAKGEPYLLNLETGERARIYPMKIIIEARAQNIDTDDIEILVLFCCEDGEKRIWVRLRDLNHPDKIMDMIAAKGGDVRKETKNLLCRYLQDYYAKCCVDMEFLLDVSRIGWLDKDSPIFSPYDSKVRYQNNSAFPACNKSLQQIKGTPEGWISLIKNHRDKTHIAFRIIIAASFSSVLLTKLGLNPYLLYIRGTTGIGKSVALYAAASVWGDPGIESEGYVQQFSASIDALELQSQFFGDLPYCLDERQLKKTAPSDLIEYVYRLTSGRPKQRAIGTGGFREQNSWNHVIMLTGELDLIPPSGGGDEHRLFSLDVSDKIINVEKQSFADFLHGLNEQYNTVGRLFIEYLKQDGIIEKVKSLYEQFFAEIPSQVAGRQRIMGAVILTADTLATELFFKDGISLTVDDLLPFLKLEEDVNRSAKAHKAILDWIKTNPGKFDVSHDEFYGRFVHAEKSSDYYAFVPAQFEKLAEELRFSVKDYLGWARSVGILITDSDRGRFKKKVLLKSGDKPVACYCIRADIEQEADDAPQDSVT